MSPARRNPSRRPRGADATAGGRDLWARVPPTPPAEPILPAADPSALIRSLGVPPLPGQTAVAEHYLAAVIARAATVASALAASADLLATPEDEV